MSELTDEHIEELTRRIHDTYPTRRTLIVTLEGFNPDPHSPDVQLPEPGEIVGVIATDIGTSNRMYRSITKYAPITNQSYEPRWEGWLGCTNDENSHAEGAYRVVSISMHKPALYNDRKEDTYRVSLVRVGAPQA